MLVTTCGGRRWRRRRKRTQKTKDTEARQHNDRRPFCFFLRGRLEPASSWRARVTERGTDFRIVDSGILVIYVGAHNARVCGAQMENTEGPSPIT